MNIGIDASLIGLERGPIDVAGMMFGKKHRPLGHGQMTSAPPESSLFVDIPFITTPSVDVSTSIHRIGEYLMESVVAGRDPTDCALHLGSQGEGEALERNQSQTLRTDPNSVNFAKTVRRVWTTDSSG